MKIDFCLWLYFVLLVWILRANYALIYTKQYAMNRLERNISKNVMFLLESISDSSDVYLVLPIGCETQIEIFNPKLSQTKTVLRNLTLIYQAICGLHLRDKPFSVRLIGSSAIHLLTTVHCLNAISLTDIAFMCFIQIIWQFCDFLLFLEICFTNEIDFRLNPNRFIYLTSYIRLG